PQDGLQPALLPRQHGGRPRRQVGAFPAPPRDRAVRRLPVRPAGPRPRGGSEARRRAGWHETSLGEGRGVVVGQFPSASLWARPRLRLSPVAAPRLGGAKVIRPRSLGPSPKGRPRETDPLPPSI